MKHLLCDFALPYETAISNEYEKFKRAELSNVRMKKRGVNFSGNKSIYQIRIQK